MTERVTARYKTRQIHLFPWTVGCAEDGSLWGQVASCGMVVDDPDDWQEGDVPPTCGNCLNRQAERAARQWRAGHRTQ